jgi:bifunctional non-homologous end joining protein LigD
VSPERVTVDVDGRELTLSNLGKVLYPDAGFTKGDVVDYYARVADVMLPHVSDRAVTFKRFPNGVEGSSFFEKHIPSHAPSWVQRVTVPRGANSRFGEGDIEYAVIADRPTLVWAANLAALEFHVPQWRIGDGRHLPKPPDLMVFDLDPGPGTTIVECCIVAGWLAEEIGRDGVAAKTSGSKGLQLYLRLADDAIDANELAHELARKLERDHPDAVVSNMKKELRGNKVLIDWSQNSQVKTTIAVYSLRARPRPTVSTPVTWDEIDACVASGQPQDLEFLAEDVLRRIERHGDDFGVVLDQGPR